MFASDFRSWAREVLRGRWGVSIGVCIIGGLLAGGVDMVSGVIQASSEAGSIGMLDLAANDAWPMMVTVTLASMLIALIIGGAVTLGIAHYFTNLASHRPSKFGDVFSRFNIWHKGVWMSIVMSFFIILWSLLGILPMMAVITWMITVDALQSGSMIVVLLLMIPATIPGVIATYRYAMVPYLIAEFPDLSVMDAMRESKRLMKGNKWRLFCLNFSFIGWALLASLTFGIGLLWLEPYMQTSNAAFYLDVTGRTALRHAPNP